MNIGRLIIVLVSSLILSACAFPSRDYSMVPDAAIISVDYADGKWHANPPDCDNLREEPRNRYDNRPQIAFGCATYTNLANSVANPRDLNLPKSYAGQNATTADSAVQRYLADDVTPLNETSSTKGTD